MDLNVRGRCLEREVLRKAQGVSRLVSVLSLILASLSFAGFIAPEQSVAATTSAQLLPAGGQFFPISGVSALDTRSGTGGVPVAPLAAGASATFSVAGIGGVPSTDVADVYVVITAVAPAGSGALEDYDPDGSNPGIWTVPFSAGQTVSVSDMVQVSSSGTISLINSSSGSTDASVTVLGYVQDAGSDVVGDTYVALPYGGILDTRSGYGAPAQAQIPAGGSVTVQVAGNAGVPQDAAGAALYIGAANATQNGWISAYQTGSTDPDLPVVSYTAGQTVRNLYYGTLSSAGQVTLVNHGTAPVDMMAAVQGYLVSPGATEAGSAYTAVTPQRIADTRSGAGGVPASPVPAGGSITFTATGADGVPSSNVSAVVESVAASSPTATGLLSVYPAGGADPGNAGVNFYAGASQDNDLTAPLVSALSPSGRETITNHSSGTVDVIVTIKGYYSAPTSPAGPDSVLVTISGSSATIDWDAPASDGGAAISSYTVVASPDNATVTVGGDTTEATLTGLANAARDTFKVTAANILGSSVPTGYIQPGTITGTVVAPNAAATPVTGDPVTIVANANPSSDPTSDPTTVTNTPTVIGTATTDSKGQWSFTAPSYSQLPADAQAEAAANDGYLNVDAISMGTAITSGGNQYTEAAIEVQSVWVGTATETQPLTDNGTDAQPLMIMRPDNSDQSALDTAAAEAATEPSIDSAVATDSSGNNVGNAAWAYALPPADAHGYQELGSENTYNPNVAADGTDLTNVPVTVPSSQNCCYPPRCFAAQIGGARKRGDFWTVIGEFHSNWNDLGWLSYTKNATSRTGSEISFDDQAWSFGGFDTYSSGSGLTQAIGDGAPYQSYQVKVYMKWKKTKWGAYQPINPNTQWPATLCYTWLQWDEAGVTNPPSGPDIEEGASIPRNQEGAGHNNWHTDGEQGLGAAEANHPGWVLGEPWPYSICVDRSHGYIYGKGVTVFGIGIRTEADKSSAEEQCLEYNGANGMPNSSRDDFITGVSDNIHYMWPADRPFNFNSTGTEPKVFYNY